MSRSKRTGSLALPTSNVMMSWLIPSSLQGKLVGECVFETDLWDLTRLVAAHGEPYYLQTVDTVISEELCLQRR
jgi:hypothetical protein